MEGTESASCAGDGETEEKSGGVRVIYYYHDERIPLYLLTLFGKNEQANLSKSDRHFLAQLVDVLVTSARNSMTKAFESIKQGLRKRSHTSGRQLLSGRTALQRLMLRRYAAVWVLRRWNLLPNSVSALAPCGTGNG
jgi:hypothetical protein